MPGGIQMLGQPKYKRGDTVSFEMRGEVVAGEVYIVDAYGTFEQNEEPSYDVMIVQDHSEKCLVKHVRESWIL